MCPREYTCEDCGGQFEDTWDHEGRMDEVASLFPEEVERGEPMVRICHKCWLKLMGQAEAEGLIGPQWRKEL